MDGTLVDSELCAAQAIYDVIPKVSITPDEIVYRYRGMNLTLIFSDISQRFGVQMPSDVVERYRDQESLLSASLIQVIPGVEGVLENLQHHSCIASNAPRKKTYRSLKACRLEHHFADRVYSAYDVDAWKPDPTLFLHAAREEGFTPQQCIVVEDSDVGISAAKAAQMTPIFYNPHGRETEHLDVMSISSFHELQDIID